MKNTLETRLGMFIVLAMLAAFIILHLLGTFDLFKRGYHVRARFSNIQELKVGDPVKLAGFPVGRVEKISLAPGESKVELTLRLNKDTPIRTDSKATIKIAGLVGANYVSVDFGSAGAPMLEENQLMTTFEEPDLSALMVKLDSAAGGIQNLTKSFTGDKIDNLLGPFTDFLKQNNPRISAILANAQAVSAQVVQGKGTVGKLIYEESLYNTASSAVTNFQDAAAEIKDTVARARAIVDQVNAGKGTVGKLVTDDALYRESTDSMKTLHEILQKINTGQGSVGKLVNDKEFYKNAQLSLQKLDKATESLEDTGPLSLLGSVISTLL
jgi:phospholipid/cholesterol/gamma-HCH transport system substrate-binding protein